jgi:hypothetical protein
MELGNGVVLNLTQDTSDEVLSGYQPGQMVER